MCHQTSWCLFVSLIVAVPGAAAQTASTVPDVSSIVARMASARTQNRNRFRPYTVTREYSLFGKEKEQPKSQVIADVVFVPPGSKNYTIQQATGSSLGGSIIRRTLTYETEVAKSYALTDYSPENYDFQFLRQDVLGGHACYVLELLPRRKDQYLVHGNLWVDAGTYLPRRFEGEPARNPSWWVRDMRISFVYSEVGGMWLPTALQASADLRWLGRYTMVSQDVRYKLNKAVVAVAASQATNPHLAQIVSPRQ
ncbi:MAG TPA: outer membrane lipoprotein-sorting protein [Terriglobia bacterium]|nr:outer membrane lipoprotein-sorting protein [Terriglobia bacterium]